MITDSSFSQLSSNNMKGLILLLVLASGRGMSLGKNAASFQRKAEQWRRDNDLSDKNEARLAPKHFPNERKVPLTFKYLSAENEAPLTFNHFSDENEGPVTFKRLFPENEALLARPLDENEVPFTSKHLSDEDEAPLKSFYSELISETLYLEKYREIIINSGANLRGYNFKYNKPDFAVDHQDSDDGGDDDDDDDDDNYDNYDNYNKGNCDDYDHDVIYDDCYAENWADVDNDDDYDDDDDVDVDDVTNAMLMILY